MKTLTLLNWEEKNIKVFSSIQLKFWIQLDFLKWIQIQLNCIQFNSHYANLFNAFIWIELEFHKIKLLKKIKIISSLKLVWNSMEPKLYNVI
jgi:hypothetical protein